MCYLNYHKHKNSINMNDKNDKKLSSLIIDLMRQIQ